MNWKIWRWRPWRRRAHVEEALTAPVETVSDKELDTFDLLDIPDAPTSTREEVELVILPIADLMDQQRVAIHSKTNDIVTGTINTIEVKVRLDDDTIVPITELDSVVRRCSCGRWTQAASIEVSAMSQAAICPRCWRIYRGLKMSSREYLWLRVKEFRLVSRIRG